MIHSSNGLAENILHVMKTDEATSKIINQNVFWPSMDQQKQISLQFEN